MISTHTPLTGRDGKMGSEQKVDDISTHTPLTGRDGFIRKTGGKQNISTHTPLTGRDKTTLDRIKTSMYHFYSHAPYGT